MSRATFYNWIAAYKQDILERSQREGMKPEDLERKAKADLIAEVEALRLENRKLRDRLVAEMMRNPVER